MINCNNKALCDFSECDLLALTTLITKEIAKIIEDVDTLAMIADLFTAVGDNLTLLAGQRERCAKKVADNIKENKATK